MSDFCLKKGCFSRPEIRERWGGGGGGGGGGGSNLGASIVYDLFGSELIGGGYICGPTIEKLELRDGCTHIHTVST